MAVDIFNHPPVADADGPYIVNIGDGLTLDGTGSYDINIGDSIVLYEWDINNDSTYDWSGVTPTYNVSFSSLGDFIVKLRVTDSFGDTDIDFTTVSVVPVPVPSTILLSVLGLGVAGVKLRKYA